MIVGKASFLRVGVLLLLLAAGGASYADGKRIAFVGCPVMRDMEMPARPCWLAQDGDKLYFVGMQ